MVFSRTRYGLIRQCRANSGVNPLEECKPVPIDLHLSIRQIDPNIIQPSRSSAPQPVLPDSTAEIGTSNWLEVEGENHSAGGQDSTDVKLPEPQFLRLRRQLLTR